LLLVNNIFIPRKEVNRGAINVHHSMYARRFEISI
jgi:hypothetical protein